MALLVALFNSEMGPKPFREIATALDLPAPSTSGLQKSGYTYSDLVVRTNEADMAEKAKVVKEFKARNPFIQADMILTTPLPDSYY